MASTIKKIIKFIKNPDNYRNTLYIRYHFLKAWQKMLIKLGVKKDIEFHKKDTFNWSLYNLHYRGELKQSLKEFTQTLNEGDYIFSDKKLKQINDKIKPLHMNHLQMYETILQLNPLSIFELGCGNGMHLHNLQVLIPTTKLFAVDLLKEQLDFLHNTYPELNADLKQMDATIPFSEDMPKVDLAFTQAVLMHIHTDNKHLVALANLFKISKKYVILFESTRTHNYLADMKKLHANGLIKWDKIYYYYSLNPVTGQPGSFICSYEPLDYPVLTDINIFKNA
jgi:SAM-dependent methyltransferase